MLIMLKRKLPVYAVLLVLIALSWICLKPHSNPGVTGSGTKDAPHCSLTVSLSRTRQSQSPVMGQNVNVKPSMKKLTHKASTSLMLYRLVS